MRKTVLPEVPDLLTVKDVLSVIARRRRIVPLAGSTITNLEKGPHIL